MTACPLVGNVTCSLDGPGWHPVLAREGRELWGRGPPRDMLSEVDGELCKSRAAVQGMLNHRDSRKALGYFLGEFPPSTPAETKA